MKIWIDLANSPQVLFFKPILDLLKVRNHQVEITARAYAQTTQLADKFGLQYTLVGKHGGIGMVGLMRENLLRGIELARWARPRGFDLALSHNSYSQIFASKLLRIPSVTIMDYEHQPLNHLGFRLAKRVVVPEAFPKELIIKFGAKNKTATYPGIKEQVYLADFRPEHNFRSREGFPSNIPLVVIRPPAPWTAYHRFKNELFDQVLSLLSQKPNRFILFLPRTSEQLNSIRSLPDVHIADRVYDGPNLLYCADVVISGGGTMNREAAVLGTPVYTVFKGKPSAVDRFLIDKGRMIQLIEPKDFTRLNVALKSSNHGCLLEPELVLKVIDLILES